MRFIVPLVSLAFLALTSNSSAAQAEFAWDFGYRAPGGPEQIAAAMAEAPDGGVVTANLMRADLTATTGPLTIAKFSENGDRGWVYTRTVGVCSFSGCGTVPTSVDVDSNGNVYTAFRISGSARLVKLDANGALLWDVPLETASVPNVGAPIVALDSMERPVIGCTTDVLLFPYPAVLQFSQQEVELWSRFGPTQADILGMELAPNGDIALFGRTDYLGFGTNQFGQIRVYNPDGSFKWSGVLSADGYGTFCCGTYWHDIIDGLEFDDAGNLFAFCNGDFGSEWFQDGWIGFAIARYSPSGALDYRTAVSSPRQTYGVDLAVDQLGGAYVVGREEPIGGGTSRQLTAWKIDPQGDLEWRFEDPVPHVGESAAQGVSVLPSGDLLVTGRQDTANAGLHLVLDPSGALLGRRRRANETAAADLGDLIRPTHFVARGSDQVYSQRLIGDQGLVSRWVVGGPVGTTYCSPAEPNSTGQAAQIEAIGSEVASEENLTLRLSGLPPGSFSMIVSSPMQGNVPLAGGGQGTLCLAGTIGRHNQPGEIRRTRLDGSSSLRVNTAELPNGTGFESAMAGQTRNFQAWYRDANPGTTSNFSSAVEVLFL